MRKQHKSVGPTTFCQQLFVSVVDTKCKSVSKNQHLLVNGTNNIIIQSEEEKKFCHRSKMKMILLFFSLPFVFWQRKSDKKAEREKEKKWRKKLVFFHSAHRLFFYCTHTLTHRDRIGWNGETERSWTEKKPYAWNDCYLTGNSTQSYAHTHKQSKAVVKCLSTMLCSALLIQLYLIVRVCVLMMNVCSGICLLCVAPFTWKYNKKQQQQEYLWISTDRQRIRSLFYAEYKKWKKKKVDTVQLNYAHVKNKTLRKYVWNTTWR